MPLALLASKAKEGAKPGVPVAVVFWLSLKKAPCVSIPVVAFTPELPIMLGKFPNITGTTKTMCNGEPEGAFYTINKAFGGYAPGGNNYIGFNASLSNPIYNNSDTVQPQSAYTFIIIKV